MTEYNGMAAGLSAEEQQRVVEAMERMAKRAREGNYRTGPANPAKAESMAPWMQVVQKATEPPVPIPGHEERQEAARRYRAENEEPSDE